MVVQLLQPVYLWGLLGLAVPIAIHLLHKRSQRVVKVGSLQPFRGGTPVQARRLQPNELLLLLLRCLLLVIFVLLLCQPVIQISEEVEKEYLFIAPELVNSVNADSLKQAGYEPRLLQPGLPLLEEGVQPDTTRYSYWDVFQEIEKLEGLKDTVRLQFYPRQQQFTGRRPQLSRVYEALPVPAPKPEKHLAAAIQLANKQVLLQWWEKRQANWILKSDTLAEENTARALASFAADARVQSPDTLTVALQGSAAYKQEILLWQRALQIIDSLRPHTVIKLEEVPAAQSLAYAPDVWVWLSEAQPPAAFQESPAVLRLSAGEGGGNFWFRRDREDVSRYYIQHSLQEQQNNRAVMAAFLPALMELIPTKSSLEQAPVLLPAAQWQPIKAEAGVEAAAQITESLENWAWMALLLVFIIERWLSLQK